MYISHLLPYGFTRNSMVVSNSRHHVYSFTGGIIFCHMNNNQRTSKSIKNNMSINPFTSTSSSNGGNFGKRYFMSESNIPIKQSIEQSNFNNYVDIE